MVDSIKRNAWLFVLAALPNAGYAAITGTVVDAGTLAPLAGAQVRLQGVIDSPVALTGADGRFVLPVEPANNVDVAAAIAFDPQAPVNYMTESVFAFNGDDLLIGLPRLPANDNPSYVPPTSQQLCIACHGEQHQQWIGSAHARAARNEWVLDLHSGSGTPGGGAGYVYTATHAPGETGFCATCHAPLEDVFNPGRVQLNELTTNAGRDGVTCLACHQISHVNDNVGALNHLGNAVYRFPEPLNGGTAFHVFGPLPDVVFGPMRNSWQPQFESAQFCASCHQYNNPATGAPGQTTYTEWQASPFAVPGPEFKPCQSCHMENETEPGIIAIGGNERPAAQRHRHEWQGSTPPRLRDAILLSTSARQVGNQVEIDVAVENRGAGHSFPTGVSIRNAFVVVEARVGGQTLAQQGGPQLPYWTSDEVPGRQDGDYDGLPGRGYARILEGRINGQGPTVAPVLFIDAEGVEADTAIPSGSSDRSTYRFALPEQVAGGTQVQYSARLIYRRAFRALAVTKGWTTAPGGGPIEIEVASQSGSLSLRGAALAIPVGGLIGAGTLVVLVLLGSMLVGPWRRSGNG